MLYTGIILLMADVGAHAVKCSCELPATPVGGGRPGLPRSEGSFLFSRDQGLPSPYHGGGTDRGTPERAPMHPTALRQRGADPCTDPDAGSENVEEPEFLKLLK